MLPAQARRPTTIPMTSAVSTRRTVSHIPESSNGRFCQMMPVSNAISGLRRLEQSLQPESERAQKIAKREIDHTDGRERLDRLERVVADADGDCHQLADR